MDGWNKSQKHNTVLWQRCCWWAKTKTLSYLKLILRLLRIYTGCLSATYFFRFCYTLISVISCLMFLCADSVLTHKLIFLHLNSSRHLQDVDVSIYRNQNIVRNLNNTHISRKLLNIYIFKSTYLKRKMFLQEKRNYLEQQQMKNFYKSQVMFECKR